MAKKHAGIWVRTHEDGTHEVAQIVFVPGGGTRPLLGVAVKDKDLHAALDKLKVEQLPPDILGG